MGETGRPSRESRAEEAASILSIRLPHHTKIVISKRRSMTVGCRIRSADSEVKDFYKRSTVAIRND